MEARNLRKERTGIVLSNKMDKTITVAAKFKGKVESLNAAIATAILMYQCIDV